MSGNFALIFHYHKLNRYSFNALAGAIDCNQELDAIPIIPAPTSEETLRQTARMLESHDRVAVALSVMTCQMDGTARLIRCLRDAGGERLIILAGGPHATGRPEEVLRAGADIVFRGEAEISFPRVLRSLAEDRELAPVQSSEEPVNLDVFSSFSPKRGMFGPIEITRGCVFACRFCQTSQIFGARLRHRSIPEIVRQAESLRSINRKVVRLLSPNAFSYGSTDGRRLNLPMLRELLAALREAVAPDGRILFAHFPSEARPEHVTPDTLALLREFADNDEIVVGAQSGSQRMLDACGRAHTVDDILSAAGLARKYGYKIIVDFMFGLPGETEKDREESLAVMQKVVGMGARVHPHIFAPLPQTAFAEEPPGSIESFFLNTLEEFRTSRRLYENRPPKAILLEINHAV